MSWTADDLVTMVRLRAQLPSATVDGKISDAEILLIADEEIRTTVAEVMRNSREEYGVKESTTTIVSGQRDYRIPERAQVANLREIKAIDTSGNFVDMAHVDLEEIDHYRSAADPWWKNGIGFAIIGDKVRIAPDDVLVGGSVHFKYYRRPGRLVLTTDAAVSTIATVASTTSVTVSAANHSTSDVVDVIQAAPDFDSLADDITLTVSGTTYTLDSAVSDMAAGDYISDRNTSPVVQVPDSLHALLVRATVVSVLESIGAQRQLPPAYEALERQLKAARALLNPRIEGTKKHIINWNSPLRESSGRGR